MHQPPQHCRASARHPESEGQTVQTADQAQRVPDAQQEKEHPSLLLSRESVGPSFILIPVWYRKSLRSFDLKFKHHFQKMAALCWKHPA